MRNNTLIVVSAHIIILLAFVNLNAIEIEFQYISPRPGATIVSPQTSLAFRLANPLQNQVDISELQVIVIGEMGGEYPGRLYFANDQETIVFKPDQPLKEDDKVDVEITLGPPGDDKNIRYSFTTSKISEEDPQNYKSRMESIEQSELLPPPQIMGEMSVINHVSVPADFPMIDVDVLQQTAEGKIFIANMTGVPYIIIYENDGTPYFYRRMEESYLDFNLHPTGTLTMCDGLRFYEMGASYHYIDTLTAGNGYGTDFRECQLLENGNYLVIALDYQRVDMSRLISGGNPNANVLGTHAQELDRAGNVVFEFRTWDHYNILDAIGINLLASNIDYVHMNAIAVDYDGHLLTSSRHLSEITKINRQTGEIIWRLGGNNNQFEYVDDIYGISYQHDIRPVSGQPNHYTIFDNGNLHSPRFSRAVEFVIDTTAMTATKVWEYRHTPDRFTAAMGSAQRLSNGNTVINWASNYLPKVTEVTPGGEVVYEMDFEEGYSAYRNYRHQWEGIADVPYLLVESYTDRVALIFNKFGDDQVDYYRIYAGQSSNPTTVIDSTSNTWIDLLTLENNQRYYFRVTAVSFSGQESDFSNQVDAMIHYVPPGENLILNGDFAEGGLNWDLIITGTAQATGGVENGQYRIQIINAVADPGQVQLRQDDIELLQDRHYRLEFDAYAANSRTAEVRLQMSSIPNTDYSRIGAFALNQSLEHYSYDFTMEETSDLEALLVFNVANTTDDVYLDNISLIQIVSAPERTGNVPDLVYQEDSGIQLVIADLNSIFEDSDQDDPLTITTSSDNQHIAPIVDAYSLSVQSETNYFGSGTMIVTGTDITHLSISDTFNVTIIPVNDPPEFVGLPDTVGVEVDNPTILDIWGFVWDPESTDEQLSYHFEDNSDFVDWEFDNASGEFTISIQESYSDPDAIYITVVDDSGAVASDSLVIISGLYVSLTDDWNKRVPSQYLLMQNYPNPFNPKTIIDYELPITNYVSLNIYNLVGQKVAILVSGNKQAGFHQVEWDASGHSSGVYYYRLQAGDFVEVKKMILMR